MAQYYNMQQTLSKCRMEFTRCKKGNPETPKEILKGTVVIAPPVQKVLHG